MGDDHRRRKRSRTKSLGSLSFWRRSWGFCPGLFGGNGKRLLIPVPNESPPSPTRHSTMTLAEALASDRVLHSSAAAVIEANSNDGSRGSCREAARVGVGRPEAEENGSTSMSLMWYLMEESEREMRKEEETGDWVCCVCVGRKKGAALIPCGHTYCRVCAREFLMCRGTCPLCNTSILDILAIY